MRIEEYGIRVGDMPRGALNKITDVPGVRVGHATICGERCHTGVTVILPCEDNMFRKKPVAACHVANGFGKTQGLVQVDELGTLETPIALTNTLNVGIVHDALVTEMARRCAEDRIAMKSVNPIVGECNDSTLSDILQRPVNAEHVFSAIANAEKDFAEGCVGAGAGTICHGLKGGIGSASRLVEIAGVTYAIGVLVQTNHGILRELTIRGRRIGEEILQKRATAHTEPPTDKGSCMMVLATDLPVTDRQLRRILRRVPVGLARCGSYFGHGSGDIVIGFSTANRMPHGGMDRVMQWQCVTEHTLETAFRAAAEACEEAVLNSLAMAVETTGYDGTVIECLSKYL